MHFVTLYLCDSYRNQIFVSRTSKGLKICILSPPGLSQNLRIHLQVKMHLQNLVRKHLFFLLSQQVCNMRLLLPHCGQI